MKIMVSGCLLGHNCKYNGGNNKNQEVLDLLKGHEIVPVCPESMGGLPIPRPPAEIVNGVVVNKEGLNVDSQFRKGSEEGLKLALKEKIDFAILKANSPSCGSNQIYDGTFTGTKIPGDGTFAAVLKKSGIKVFTEEELSTITL